MICSLSKSNLPTPSADERAPFCRIRARGNTWSVERYHGDDVPPATLATGIYGFEVALRIGEILDQDLAVYAARLAGEPMPVPDDATARMGMEDPTLRDVVRASATLFMFIIAWARYALARWRR